MRLAVLSDLHGNLPAWNAVHADIRARGVDRIVCLGDVVGYGPSPAEVLDSAYRNVHHFVLGNHDAVIGGLKDASGFNDDARRLIAWARRRLGRRADRFFRRVPLTLRGEGCLFAHGSAWRPGAFPYVRSGEEARACFGAAPERLIFLGHTHQPRIHRLSPAGDCAQASPPAGALRLDPACRYILNVGSVGLSRDADPRACYALLDTEAGTVAWPRVAFDLDAFIEAAQRAYGTEVPHRFLIDRLRRAAGRPVREAVDFTPGDERVAAVVPISAEMGALRRQAARWRSAAVASAAVLLLLVAGGATAWGRLPEERTLLSPVRLEIPSPGTGGFDCLAGPDCAAPPDGWAWRLGDARRQSVRRVEGRLRLESAAPEREIEILLPPLRLPEGRKITLEYAVAPGLDFSGERPALFVDLVLDSGEIIRGAERKILPSGKQETQHTAGSKRLPRAAVALRPRLVGRFAGTLEVARLLARMPEAR